MKTKLLKIKDNRGIFLEKGSDRIAVMIGGFERAATTEKKFKELADQLSISSFRFDYSGVGLSDGNFRNMTIGSMKKELRGVLEEFDWDYKKIIIVSHSLSGCVVSDMKLFKRVMISPALNQKELLRYYFVVSNFKNKKKIEWHNYRDYLNENEFLEYCAGKGKMTKSNFIDSDYFIENKDKDYSELVRGDDNILHIHGDKDDKVPIESLNVDFPRSIIVKKGNHDLERPDMIRQWIDETVKFIKE